VADGVNNGLQYVPMLVEFVILGSEQMSAYLVNACEAVRGNDITSYDQGLVYGSKLDCVDRFVW
jgi:hypothetical protein